MPTLPQNAAADPGARGRLPAYAPPVVVDAAATLDTPVVPVASEQDRADLWSLFGALFLRPSLPLLHSLAQAPAMPPGDEPVLSSAWLRMTVSARDVGAEAIQWEYEGLFEAVGSPLIDPCASLYCSGHRMDRTLARLRAELRALGQARRPSAAHTEDHLGALCETMRLLIQSAGSLSQQAPSVQKRFFAAHLLPWAGACLHDIRQARGAVFYAAVADGFLAHLDHECRVLGLDIAH